MPPKYLSELEKSEVKKILLADEDICKFITEEMWAKENSTGKKLQNVAKGKMLAGLKKNLNLNDEQLKWFVEWCKNLE